jgi:uncharacterized protein
MEIPADGIISTTLVARLRRDFKLDWNGIHGALHWARVMHHGVSLAGGTGANSRVVWLFAVLHDSKRRHGCRDPNTGAAQPTLPARYRAKAC